MNAFLSRILSAALLAAALADHASAARYDPPSVSGAVVNVDAKARILGPGPRSLPR